MEKINDIEQIFKASYVTLAKNFIHDNRKKYSRSELYIQFEQYTNKLELDAMLEILQYLKRNK